MTEINYCVLVIPIEPESKSAMKFHVVKCTYPGMVHSKLLYNSQIHVHDNLIDFPKQLDSYFNPRGCSA